MDIAGRLLRWFRKHRRPLPWRRTRDPYPIWISEVMLQQTQVATVIPYFERFLRSFPTLSDLAAATEQDVLRHWQGLGYYRRARDLHRSARLLLKEHDGVFPRDPVVLRKLPGFGRYTVGAVLSQAFDERLPILEANSRRVLCRLFGVRGDPRTPAVERQLWQVAEEVLPGRDVGEFNQALMELGALVCLVDRPGCDSCPLHRDCKARQQRLQDRIPLRTRPEAIESLEEVAVVVRRGRRVLLVQRPQTGRWAGLWEFPRGPRRDGATAAETAVPLLLNLTGIRAEPRDEIVTIRHGIMRFRITLTCIDTVYAGGRFVSGFYRRGRWLDVAQLPGLPASSPQRRLAQAVLSS